MLNTEILENMKNASPDEVVVMYSLLSPKWQSLPPDIQEILSDRQVLSAWCHYVERQASALDETGASLEEFLQHSNSTKSYQAFYQALIEARQVLLESHDQEITLPSDAPTQSNVITPSKRPGFGFMKGTGRIHGNIVAPVLPESEWNVLHCSPTPHQARSQP